MSEMIMNYIRQYSPEARQALDVGAATGTLASIISNELGMHFVGIEPSIGRDSTEINGVKIMKASADDIPFDDGTFDIVTFTSVYEHIRPDLREKSLREIARVLKHGGLLIGQIPNMYFPVEPHSKLPLTSYLPRRLAGWYHACFSPVSRGSPQLSWFRVSAKSLGNNAIRAGFKTVSFKNYSRMNYVYSRSTIAMLVRRAYSITRFIPLGYEFCFVKPSNDLRSGNGTAA